MAKPTLTVHIADTDFFQDVVGFIKTFLGDETIPKDVREKYENKLDEILNKYERSGRYE